MTEEQEKEHKRLFAKALIKCPEDPLEAGLAAFPKESFEANYALFAANNWVEDPYVVELVGELKPEASEVYEKENLRNTLITKLLSLVTEESLVRVSADERIKAAKTIGELKGLIEKPQTNIMNNVATTTNKVMVIREEASFDSWSEGLRNQQRVLTNAASG